MVENLREIIFDTETTGLSSKDGDRIIEIGAIELINRFPTGKTYHVYINPEDREVHPDAYNVHGIGNDDLKDKPVFTEILDDFLAFFENAKLIAHNASFDMGFVNAELQRAGKTPIDASHVIDTLQIARRKFPGQRNSLDALCARFGIDNSHREKHGALLDSELLAEVYIELLGGKQASLGFEQQADSNSSAGGAEENFTAHKISKRQNPLPPRLTQEEIERHNEFIATLGDDAIWKKLA